MILLTEINNYLYSTLSLPKGRQRRTLLIDEMKNLIDKNINCFSCSGTCCTYSANSMQITPLEAFEIILSLGQGDLVKIKLEQNIKDFRLGQEISLGKKGIAFLRKNYTCPFFTASTKGCSVQKDLKPYGCLAFNPKIENDNGRSCGSHTDLLKKREEYFLTLEDQANQYLRNKLNLNWAKLEIPRAVLDLINNIE